VACFWLIITDTKIQSWYNGTWDGHCGTGGGFWPNMSFFAIHHSFNALYSSLSPVVCAWQTGRLWQPHRWTVASPGMLHHVDCWTVTGVLKDCSSFVCFSVASVSRWGHHITLNCNRNYLPVDMTYHLRRSEAVTFIIWHSKAMCKEMIKPTKLFHFYRHSHIFRLFGQQQY